MNQKGQTTFSTSFKKSKRAQAKEILTLGIVMFILGITILVAFTTIREINLGIQNTTGFSTQGKDAVNDYSEVFPNVFDAVYVLAVVLTSLAVIISLFLLDSHPIFIVISFPALLFVIFVNVILANAFDDIATTEAFGHLYDQLPMTQFLAQNWLFLIIVISGASIIALYSKRVAQ